MRLMALLMALLTMALSSNGGARQRSPEADDPALAQALDWLARNEPSEARPLTRDIAPLVREDLGRGRGFVALLGGQMTRSGKATYVVGRMDGFYTIELTQAQARRANIGPLMIQYRQTIGHGDRRAPQTWVKIATALIPDRGRLDVSRTFTVEVELVADRAIRSPVAVRIFVPLTEGATTLYHHPGGIPAGKTTLKFAVGPCDRRPAPGEALQYGPLPVLVEICTPPDPRRGRLAAEVLSNTVGLIVEVVPPGSLDRRRGSAP